MSGDIGGTPFTEAPTVFSAGPYLLLVDREIDCIEADWLARSYAPDAAPTETPLVALQFSTDEDAFAAGTSSVEGAAAVNAWGILNTGTYEALRARTGTITLDEVSDDAMEGSFSLEFAEGAVEGTFRSEYCRNMAP